MTASKRVCKYCGATFACLLLVPVTRSMAASRRALNSTTTSMRTGCSVPWTHGQHRRGERVRRYRARRDRLSVIDRDVFIIHAEEDTAFVKGRLLPMLALPDERVILSSELPFPAFVEQAIETSVRRSRLTLAVLSPAYLRDRWASFAELLSRNVRRNGRDGSTSGNLVPLLIADCEIPPILSQHTTLDFRDWRDWDACIAQLRRELHRR